MAVKIVYSFVLMVKRCAGRELLKGLHLKNKVVCADAMQTQRAFCVQVLSGGGDYLLFAKKNQPTLWADIEQFFY